MRRRKKLCKGCKEYFRPKDTDPEKIAFCSTDCAVAIVKAKWARDTKNKERSLRKAQNADNKAHKERKRVFKQNDSKHQFQLTKKEAQKLANKIDKDLPCISCGRTRGEVQFCGGHCKTAGGHPELALDLRNIHGQCNQLCNMQKSGNISGDKHSKGYTEGLRERYGDEMVEYLNGHHPTAKRSCDDLIALRAIYAKEIRYIDKHGSPSKNWRALEVNR